MISICYYIYVPFFGDEIMKKEEIKEMPLLVQRFCNYQTAVKNKSQLTVLEYASDLRSFFRFLIMDDYKDIEFEEIPVKDIDEKLIINASDADVYAFLTYCRNDRYNNENTRSRKVSSIRSFYKWLTVTEKKLEVNPMEHLDSPKLKKSLPKYLTLDESLELLRHIDGPNRERDYLIIMLFLNCGLRLSELVALNVNDIRSDKTMIVTGKGNKQRMIYLNDSCLSAYYSYMKVRPTEGIPASQKDALFISRNKKRISPKTVQHIVYSLLEKSGLEDRGFSTHKLRHTAATLMYRHSGADVMLLKELLGHESLATTEIYTHVANEQLRDAVDNNPLNIPSNENNSEDENVDE